MAESAMEWGYYRGQYGDVAEVLQEAAFEIDRFRTVGRSLTTETLTDGIQYDAQTNTYVARYTILTAGRTEDEAKAALASAVRLLAKTWPERAGGETA